MSHAKVSHFFSKLVAFKSPDKKNACRNGWDVANLHVNKIFQASYLEITSSIFISWARDGGCTSDPSGEVVSVTLLDNLTVFLVIVVNGCLSICVGIMGGGWGGIQKALWLLTLVWKH